MVSYETTILGFLLVLKGAHSRAVTLSMWKYSFISDLKSIISSVLATSYTATTPFAIPTAKIEDFLGWNAREVTELLFRPSAYENWERPRRLNCSSDHSLGKAHSYDEGCLVYFRQILVCEAVLREGGYPIARLMPLGWRVVQLATNSF